VCQPVLVEHIGGRGERAPATARQTGEGGHKEDRISRPPNLKRRREMLGIFYEPCPSTIFMQTEKKKGRKKKNYEG